MIELGFIYCLKNPLTEEIFYIGATESAPKDRLKGHYEHFKEYLKGDRNSNKRFEYFEYFECIWPELAKIELLEIVQNDYLYRLEQNYISKYSEVCKLTNQTIGGEGGDTFTGQSVNSKKQISELIRKKAIGKKKPEGFAEHLLTTRMGKNNPMAGKSKLGWVVCLDINDQPLQLMKFPFEITAFLENRGLNHNKSANATGNISKAVRYNKFKTITSQGFIWKDYTICDDKIQDIVLSNYENN